MSFWSNISAVLGYDASAPFYTDPATGQITQAKANADGEYILPTQANGEPVERIPDSDPRVKSSLISTYGYDPTSSSEDFRYGQGGETTQMLNRETGQYETAVINPQTGNKMPISAAQAQGIPYQGLGGYQSGGGVLSEILGGVGEIGKVLGPLAAVAGGANFLGGLGAAGAGAGEAASGFGALGAEDALMGQGFNSLSPGMSAGTAGATSAAGGFGGAPGGGMAGGYTLPDYGVPGLTSLPPYYAGAAPAAAEVAGAASPGIIQQLANFTGLSTSAIERLGGAAISGLASLASAGMTSDAAKKAAQRIADSNASSNQLMAQINAQNQARQEPFYQAGLKALPAYSQGVMPGGNLVRPFSNADFQADPGYGFRLSEGMKTLENSAASRGNLLSGATLKGIQKYGQGLASQEYQNAYNRYTGDQATQRNALASLTGFAPTASSAMQAGDMAYGSNAANLASNTANAMAGAGATRSSSYGNALAGIGQNVYNAMNPNPMNSMMAAYMQNQMTPRTGGF